MSAQFPLAQGEREQGLTVGKKTSIASCAYFVNRNTSVLSIFFYGDIKHSRTAVTSKVAIKVEVISMDTGVGICTTV